MKWMNVFRASLLPLTFLFLTLGTILMLTGAAKFFSLDAREVQRDGLSRQLDIFTDCGSKVALDAPIVQQRIRENSTTPPPTPPPAPAPAPSPQATPASLASSPSVTIEQLQEPARGGGGGASTEHNEANSDVMGLLQNRCEIQQRPYKFFLLWTGAAVGLTLLLLAWLIFRAPSGLLSWLAMHTAITIALLVGSIYVAMQLMTNTRELADCTGFNQTSIAEINRQGFVCYNNPNRPTASRLIDHWTTIFWVGLGFSLAGMGLLSLLLSLMHWAKERWGDSGDIDMSTRRGGGAHTTTSGYGPSGYDSRYDHQRYTDHRPGMIDRMMGRDRSHQTDMYPTDTRGGSATTTTEHRTPGPIDRALGRGDQHQQTTTYYDRDRGDVRGGIGSTGSSIGIGSGRGDRDQPTTTRGGMPFSSERDYSSSSSRPVDVQRNV